MPLLAIFMALPVLYVIPYVFSAVLPPLVTRGLTRFAGYWFSFSYYATMLLIPGLLLWIAAQLMGRNDLWQGTISVYYSAFAFALSWLLLAIGAWRGHHQIVRTVDIETDKSRVATSWLGVLTQNSSSVAVVRTIFSDRKSVV